MMRGILIDWKDSWTVSSAIAPRHFVTLGKEFEIVLPGETPAPLWLARGDSFALLVGSPQKKEPGGVTGSLKACP